MAAISVHSIEKKQEEQDRGPAPLVRVENTSQSLRRMA